MYPPLTQEAYMLAARAVDSEDEERNDTPAMDNIPRRSETDEGL